MLFGLIEPSLLLDEPAKRVVRGGATGVELQDLLVTSDRLGEKLLFDGGLGQKTQKGQGAWLQFARAAEMDQCFVPVVFLLQYQTEADMCLGELGVKSQRLEVAQPRLR